MTPLHFMFDLETMGPEPDGAIVAIGAVRFDPYEGEIVDTFYRTIPIASNISEGRVVNPDTVEWWLKQSDAARLALFDEPRRDLKTALRDFSYWAVSDMDSEDCFEELHKCGRLWSHATFDEVLLRHAFANTGSVGKFPFHPKFSRDMRTITEIAKGLGMKKPKKNADKHNALADARFQAEGVIAVYQELGMKP